MEVSNFKRVLNVFYKSHYDRFMAQLKNKVFEKASSDEFSMVQVGHFISLTNDKIIQQFLQHDRCCMMADKYLLSMVFVYFLRANLPLTNYTRLNFFVALYLAHDMEEDDEDLKECFVVWGLGVKRKDDFDYFIGLRNKMWRDMDFRACVCIKSCHRIMEAMPNCSLWKRERDPAHGGAVRSYHPQSTLDSCKNCDSPSDKRIFYWSDKPEGLSRVPGPKGFFGQHSPINHLRQRHQGPMSHRGEGNRRIVPKFWDRRGLGPNRLWKRLQRQSVWDRLVCQSLSDLEISSEEDEDDVEEAHIEDEEDDYDDEKEADEEDTDSETGSSSPSPPAKRSRRIEE